MYYVGHPRVRKKMHSLYYRDSEEIDYLLE